MLLLLVIGSIGNFTPQVKATPTQIDNCEDTTPWSITYGTGTKSVNSTDYQEGAGSLQFDILSTAAGVAYVQRSFSPAQDWSSYNLLSLWFKANLTALDCGTGFLQFRTYDGTSYADGHIPFTTRVSDVDANTWVKVEMPTVWLASTSASAFNWSSVESMDLGFYFAGIQKDVRFQIDDLYVDLVDLDTDVDILSFSEKSVDFDVWCQNTYYGDPENSEYQGLPFNMKWDLTVKHSPAADNAIETSGYLVEGVTNLYQKTGDINYFNLSWNIMQWQERKNVHSITIGGTDYTTIGDRTVWTYVIGANQGAVLAGYISWYQLTKNETISTRIVEALEYIIKGYEDRNATTGIFPDNYYRATGNPYDHVTLPDMGRHYGYALIRYMEVFGANSTISTIAKHIMNVLINKQNADGSWYVSYYLNGTAQTEVNPHKMLYAIEGLLKAYEYYGNSSYLTSAEKALNYINTPKQQFALVYTVVQFASVSYQAYVLTSNSTYYNWAIESLRCADYYNYDQNGYYWKDKVDTVGNWLAKWVTDVLRRDSSIAIISYPYVTSASHRVTAMNFADNHLTFTVTASSGTTSTTKVYCGAKGEPIAIYPANGTLTWSYDASTTILTLNVTHTSPTRILVYWKFPGDIDSDGDVDVEDLYIIAASYGSHVGEPTYNYDSDINGDGDIDADDLHIFAGNYRKTTP